MDLDSSPGLTLGFSEPGNFSPGKSRKQVKEYCCFCASNAFVFFTLNRAFNRFKRQEIDWKIL